MDDLIKFIIAIVIIGAAVAGLAFLSDNFTNWDVTTWFNFGEVLSEGRILPSGDFALLRW